MPVTNALKRLMQKMRSLSYCIGLVMVVLFVQTQTLLDTIGHFAFVPITSVPQDNFIVWVSGVASWPTIGARQELRAIGKALKPRPRPNLCPGLRGRPSSKHRGRCMGRQRGTPQGEHWTDVC